jgi:hypothetical protein
VRNQRGVAHLRGAGSGHRRHPGRADRSAAAPPARPGAPLDAGPFAPEIGSFRLHLAAEGKAAKTVRT